MANILKQKVFTEAVEKENRLRLAWFRRNLDRLEAGVEKPNTRTVPQELKDEVKHNRQIKHETKVRFPIVINEDAPPRKVDEKAMMNVMKPIPPPVKDILYQGENNFMLLTILGRYS